MILYVYLGKSIEIYSVYILNSQVVVKRKSALLISLSFYNK